MLGEISDADDSVFGKGFGGLVAVDAVLDGDVHCEW